MNKRTRRPKRFQSLSVKIEEKHIQKQNVREILKLYGRNEEKYIEENEITEFPKQD